MGDTSAEILKPCFFSWIVNNVYHILYILTKDNRSGVRSRNQALRDGRWALRSGWWALRLVEDGHSLCSERWALQQCRGIPGGRYGKGRGLGRCRGWSLGDQCYPWFSWTGRGRGQMVKCWLKSSHKERCQCSVRSNNIKGNPFCAKYRGRFIFFSSSCMGKATVQ